MKEKLSNQEIKDTLTLLNSVVAIEGLNKYVEAINKLEKRNTNASNN